METYNIAAALFERAASQPDDLAIALPAAPGKPLPKTGPIPYREISFSELAHETNQVARGLLAAGFEPGDRVVMLVPPSLEFFSLIFALLQAGIIPVFIDPGIGFKNLRKCIAEAEPIGFIGISKAQIGRIFLGWGRSSITKIVTVGPRFFWGGKRLRQVKALATTDEVLPCFAARPDDLCCITFTSGSTGLPKGVQYTHGNFCQQVEIIRNTFGMQAGEIDLPTFPPFALFNPTVGMSSIIPDMDPTRPASVDPERLIRTVQQFKVTSMFGSQH